MHKTKYFILASSILLIFLLSSCSILSTDIKDLSDISDVLPPVIKTTQSESTTQLAELSPEEKQRELNLRLIEAISKQRDIIDVSDLSISEDSIYLMTNDFNCSYQNYSFCFEKFSWITKEDLIVDRIEITYDDPLTVNERIAYIDSETTRIASMIDSSWSDIRKAIWINDYIYDRVKYDHDLVYRELDTALMDGFAVCEGLSGMYQEIANKAGLETTYASSKSINHVWNLVNIDGTWYNLDMTININQKDRYAAFLLSDKAFGVLIDNPSDIQQKYSCTNSFYDAFFWTESGISSVVFVDDQPYWASDNNIYSCDLKTGKTQKIGAINSSPWLMNGEPLVYNFVDLSANQTGFYYNTSNSVYHYNVLTGESTLMRKYNKSDASIFSIYIDGANIIIKRYSDYSTGQGFIQESIALK